MKLRINKRRIGTSHRSIPINHGSNISNLLHSTLPVTKKYAVILFHYRWLFVKGDIIISEWGIFSVEIFLPYS